jgi:uncharacterized protein DUF5681
MAKKRVPAQSTVPPGAAAAKPRADIATRWPPGKSGNPTKRFAPGKSGNPSGRKPGSGVVAKLRASIADHVPEIIAKLVEQAKTGDTAAARLLLERAVPPMRSAEEAVALPEPAGSLSDQGRAILAVAARGELSPSQVAQVLTGLGSLAKLIETDELARRIAALEDRNGGSNDA